MRTSTNIILMLAEKEKKKRLWRFSHWQHMWRENFDADSTDVNAPCLGDTRDTMLRSTASFLLESFKLWVLKQTEYFRFNTETDSRVPCHKCCCQSQSYPRTSGSLWLLCRVKPLGSVSGLHLLSLVSTLVFLPSGHSGIFQLIEEKLEYQVDTKARFLLLLDFWIQQGVLYFLERKLCSGQIFNMNCFYLFVTCLLRKGEQSGI